MGELTGNSHLRSWLFIAGVYIMAFYGASVVDLAADAGGTFLGGGEIGGISFNPLFWGHRMILPPFAHPKEPTHEVGEFFFLIFISFILFGLGHFCTPGFSWIPAIGVVSLLSRGCEWLWDKSLIELLIVWDSRQAVYLVAGCGVLIAGLGLAVFWFRKYVPYASNFFASIGIWGSGILIPAMILGACRYRFGTTGDWTVLVWLFCGLGIQVVILMVALRAVGKRFPVGKPLVRISWTSVTAIDLLALVVVGVCLLFCPSQMTVWL